jgi:hypothetical protein
MCLPVTARHLALFKGSHFGIDSRLLIWLAELCRALVLIAFRTNQVSKSIAFAA